jgi:hypothetical protein
MALLIPMTTEPQDRPTDLAKPASRLSEQSAPANAAFPEGNTPENEAAFEALGR